MVEPVVVRARRIGAAGVRAASLTTDPDLMTAYLEDASGAAGGRADALARPDDEAGVAAALGAASHAGWSVLPQAARSSLTAGAVPCGGLVLSVERLDRIGAVRPTGDGALVTVGAGVRLDDLARAVEPAGWFFPPTPTYRQAMIGGVASTNAGGPAGLKYGTTRDWIRALRVVLASGESLELERGAHAVPRGRSFAMLADDGRRVEVPTPVHRLPPLPKLSAGYHAAESLDLVDLFVGAEGTLGVITSVTLALARRPPAVLGVWLFADERTDVVRLAGALRADAPALDVRAIEWLDRHAVARLLAAGAARRLGIAMPADTREALYLELELPEPTSAAAVVEALERRSSGGRVDGPLARLLGRLDEHGALDRFEVVDDDEPQRMAAFSSLREAIALEVNEEIAARRRREPGLRKSGGDLIVPFEQLPAMIARCESGFEAHGLDGLVWGHLGDGNLHPNVVARDAAQLHAADELQLELGRHAMYLGGAPLAEHGVGRHPVKRRLLEAFVGRAALERMAEVKRSLDPSWCLAPGVLLGRADSHGRV